MASSFKLISSRSLIVQRGSGPFLRPSSRSVTDLIIKPGTTKPLIKYGTGGRSSVSGHVATVFGANGFLGKYVVAKLAKAGTQVIVPYRSAYEARSLRVMGDLGQIVPMEWELKNPRQIEECLRHSDVVYNCCGREWETKNYSFDEVHNEGAARIAEIAQKNGVSRLIHVSHLNADPNSTSRYYASKGRGDEAVLKAFPNATIVRPGPIYGYEDRLLNVAPKFNFLFSQNHGQTEMRPVHFSDVAQALHNLLPALSTQSLILNLPGPKTMTHQEFAAIVASHVLKKPTSRNYPKPLLKLLAAFCNKFFWWPSMDPDTIERCYIDDRSELDFRRMLRAGPEGIVPGGRLLSGWESWERCGYRREDLDYMEDVAIRYLRRMRPPRYMRVPVHAGAPGVKPKPYRVME
ncbi:NAD(P)-binding protein [Mrakia frigida]|uniref:complex I NDUFA9 subunit family protein n=1 Tax=Mrakia frigida TaxID=29902 RepID=UPI003FCC0AC6